METLKYFRNILLVHKIGVFTDHNNLTYETIETAYQHVHRWNIIMQEFGVTLIYIKEDANVCADAFILITMVYHVHKLTYTTMEEDRCQLLCLYLLFISDNIVINRRWCNNY